MSNCVVCTDPVPPCACSSDQQCIRINQSCDQCAHNVCQALDGSSGGSSNVGATAGGAVGGAAAGIVLVTLLWLFYRRKLGRSTSLPSLFGSRFHLKHSRSQSRNLGAHENELDGQEMPSRPGSRALDNRASRLSKRVSIHADDEDAEDPFADDAGAGARASVARSSQIAPISSLAYLPPDANSMTVEDGHQRTALGEKRWTGQLETISEGKAVPVKKSSTKPKSKPIPLRPDRDPALDLVLPTPSPSTPHTPDSAPPVIKLEDPESRFSSSTWATGYTGVRDSSALDSEAGETRPASAFSATSSHPSVFVDPPQLVTLSSSAERVEMARARPIVLQTSPKKAGKMASMHADENPFTDAASDMLDEALGGNGLVPSPAMRPGSTFSSMTRASGVSMPESTRASLFPGETSSVRAPSAASFSALDGIPFLASGGPDATRSSGLVPGFPQPPHRTSMADESRPTSAAGPSRGISMASWSDPLRPTSSLSGPEDVTRRSGFSSGGVLSGVPFQLAFPGERDSVAASDRMSSMSEMPQMITARSSLASEDPFADTNRHSTRSTKSRVSLTSLADLVAEIDNLPGDD